MYRHYLLLYILVFSFYFETELKAVNHQPAVLAGVDVLLSSKQSNKLKSKRIGLITNQTATTAGMDSIINALNERFKLTMLFAPEHGLDGAERAFDSISNGVSEQGIPIFSLHGEHRRPTKEVLKKIDVLIYDIQDIGSRSYTYVSTLFYAMEEAAKYGVEVYVLDRPNPMGGLIVDGPMLDEEWRSFLGYIDIPYCHGMTVGELAKFFNAEYRIKCKLTVVPMKGWKREMTFSDTGLHWIPTSPHIPEADTPFFYPSTGMILGEMSLVSTGVGYTLPFKLIGAPWIDAEIYAKHLNSQKFPGVSFQAFHFRPFYGKYKGELCHGVRIIITDPSVYLPVSTHYLLTGVLKTLYTRRFQKAMDEMSAAKIQLFNKVNGTSEVWEILKKEKYVVWPLRKIHEERRAAFLQKRKKYLISDYR